jgi:hypothetical protein
VYCRFSMTKIPFRPPSFSASMGGFSMDELGLKPFATSKPPVQAQLAGSKVGLLQHRDVFFSGISFQSRINGFLDTLSEGKTPSSPLVFSFSPAKQTALLANPDKLFFTARVLTV